MALDESKVTSTSRDSSTYSFDELQDAFDELAIDFEKMNVQYKKMTAKLSIENVMLTKAKIELEKSIDSMKRELDDLTKKNVNLQNSFSRFYMGQQKLDKMLETQRAFFNKDAWDMIVALKKHSSKIYLLNQMTHMKHLANMHIVRS